MNNRTDTKTEALTIGREETEQPVASGVDTAKVRLFSMGKAVDLLRGGTGSKADGTQSSYSQNGVRP